MTNPTEHCAANQSNPVHLPKNGMMYRIFDLSAPAVTADFEMIKICSDTRSSYPLIPSDVALQNQRQSSEPLARIFGSEQVSIEMRTNLTFVAKNSHGQGFMAVTHIMLSREGGWANLVYNLLFKGG